MNKKTAKIKKPATVEELYKIGAHFGHTREKTHPQAKNFVFSYVNKVSVINLDRSIETLQTALDFLNEKAKEGKKILLVGTKKQAGKEIETLGRELDLPYISSKWLGGTLTNFATIKKSLKTLEKLEDETKQEEFKSRSKKYQSSVKKKLAKLHLVLDGIKKLEQTPDIVFIVDADKEDIAVSEAKKIGIPIVAVSDTNSNPQNVDYPIVVNDDSPKTVKFILQKVREALLPLKAQTKEKTEKN